MYLKQPTFHTVIRELHEKHAVSILIQTVGKRCYNDIRVSLHMSSQKVMQGQRKQRKH